jgi:hypothetical protein
MFCRRFDSVAPTPSQAEGSASSAPQHVFPVLAAALKFLRRIEVALETSVFERLVGEVLQEACTFIASSINVEDNGGLGGWVGFLLTESQFTDPQWKAAGLKDES